MVAANPFKKKNSLDVSSLDLNKIISEEKEHGHATKAQTKEPVFTTPQSVKTAEKKEDADKKSAIPEASPFNNSGNDKVEMPESKQETLPSIDPTKVERPTLDQIDNQEQKSDLDVILEESKKIDLAKKDDDSDVLDINPEQEDTKRTDKAMSIVKRIKIWCWKHRRLLIALLAIIVALIIGFIADRGLNRVDITITSSGLKMSYETDDNGNEIPSEVPVRVLAYNADMGSNHDLLYYLDTMATANPDGTMNIAWEIPRDHAYKRGTYNEFCLLDESKQPNYALSEYCGGYTSDKEHNANTSKPANATESTSSLPSDSLIKYVNRISCAYYIPPHTNGLVAFLSRWNSLDDAQTVGCANDDDNEWGNSSYLDKMYGFASRNFAGLNGKAGNNGASLGSSNDDNDDNDSMSGLTMENFFQSILNSYGSDINAGDIIKNSFTNNFTYNDSTQVIDLSQTGVIAGQSCDYTSTTTIERPAPANGSDNSTTETYTCIPIFVVDKYGRITSVGSKIINYDGVTGNEVVGVTGSYSGLVRSGAGTFVDPYTLALALNSDGNGGLVIDSTGQLAIVAPECTAKQSPQVIDPTNRNRLPGNDVDKSLNKLQWTYNGENGKFTCAHDIDNQQLDMAQDSDSTVGLNNVETYTVSLSGDNASSIQFVDKDTKYIDGAGVKLDITNGANIISADVGKGLVLLCVDGTTNCPESEKVIQIDLGGDNNSGSIGGVNDGGLIIENNHLKINAPTCDISNNGDGKKVLTWDGKKFICRSGTDFNIAAQNTTGAQNIGDNSLINFRDGTGSSYSNQSTNGLSVNRVGSDIYYSINNTGVTAGNNAPTSTQTGTVRSVSVPTFTVNAQGQLTQTGLQSILSVDSMSGLTLDQNGNLTVNVGEGIVINQDGDISVNIPGIIHPDNGIEAPTCAAGSGLSWNGNKFVCSTVYNWYVKGGAGTAASVAHGSTVSFSASGTAGLTVNNVGTAVNYALNLSVGNGLSFNNTTGVINLVLRPNAGLTTTAAGVGIRSCPAGQILKAGTTAGTWACSDDLDTIKDTNTQLQGKTLCSVRLGNIKVNGNWHIQGTQAQNTIYGIGNMRFMNVVIRRNSGTAAAGEVVMHVNDTDCWPQNVVSQAGETFIDILTNQATLRFYYANDGAIRAGDVTTVHSGEDHYRIGWAYWGDYQP